MQLLIDGRRAFPEIIREIRNAEYSIYINMFIWRNDSIGNKIACEILSAADRGVKVTIVKDRYGVICESCEENRLSFFNRCLSPGEKAKVMALSILYNRESKNKNVKCETDSGELLERFFEHENITTVCDKNRYDHCKFYLFDDSTLIMGGINIEDKENGADYAGRKYHDYMVKITEPDLVRGFLNARSDPGTGRSFGMNCKERGNYFGMKNAYLRLINEAQRSLTIIMAYFSSLAEFEKAILKAAERIGNVCIVIPERANFQDDTNKKTVKRLLSQSSRIKVYLYPGMLHAKMIVSEQTISVGSCNITKKAFGQLDELNFFTENGFSDFANDVNKSIEVTIAESKQVFSADEIKYNHLLASIESVLV